MHYCVLKVCVTVCREVGPWWVCVPEGRLQPGQKSGGSQVHPAHEGWRDQTYSTFPQHAHIRAIHTLRTLSELLFFFQAPSLESRELWKGFLYSVIDVSFYILHACILVCILSLYCFTLIFFPLGQSQLNVPSCLTLLPGQLQMLKEVVEKERSRRRTRTPTRAPPSPLSVPLVGEIPP